MQQEAPIGERDLEEITVKIGLLEESSQQGGYLPIKWLIDDGGYHRFAHLPQPIFKQRCEDLIFVAKMQVKGADADIRLRGNLRDAGFVETVRAAATNSERVRARLRDILPGVLPSAVSELLFTIE